MVSVFKSWNCEIFNVKMYLRPFSGQHPHLQMRNGATHRLPMSQAIVSVVFVSTGILKVQILGAYYPDLLKLWSPAFCILLSPLCDSGVCYSLRTTRLKFNSSTACLSAFPITICYFSSLSKSFSFGLRGMRI